MWSPTGSRSRPRQFKDGTKQWGELTYGWVLGSMTIYDLNKAALYGLR